jgi:hypothetical protein
MNYGEIEPRQMSVISIAAFGAEEMGLEIKLKWN